MIYEKPEPIADFEDTREVPGRIGADGSVLRELDLEAARTAVSDLRDAGVEALTISLMHSYANPAHERALRELAREEAPALPVSISSDVMPEFREYERTVTTVMNAYVAPALDRYLSRLRSGLDAARAGAELQVVRSDGGLMSLDSARALPVHTVLSGPAGGVKGASFIAARAGFDRILTFDMGGTSTDVATCLDGEPLITRETTVGAFPVRAPSVEVESIGAGGGSIAYVAEVTGALRVGPQSAGAVPGPACYARGGTRATVTDANVVLGHLPPRLLGGEMELDSEAAHAAVAALGARLGLDAHAAAAGIVDLINESMLGALRVVTVQKGRAPADFALVSFGGAGGLHANALAALLGCYPVIVPPESGVLSALGFVVSPIKNEFSQTVIRDAEETSADELRDRLAELAAQGDRWLAGEGVAVGDRAVDYVVDMRYQRQGFEIPVAIPADELARLTLGELAERFGALHHGLYGFGLEGGAELVNLRAVARGRVPIPEIPAHDPGPSDPAPAQAGTHTVWRTGQSREVPTYRAGRAAQRHANPRLRDHRAVRRHDGRAARLSRHGRPVAEPGDRTGEPVTATGVDPITLDLIENALLNARFEMDEVVRRAAMSPTIRVQHDEFPMICNRRGQMIVGQFGSYIPEVIDRFERRTSTRAT